MPGHIEHRTSHAELRSFQALFLCATLLLSLCGCACHQPFVGSRPFNFQTDTFNYANQLKWEYHYDANGKWVHNRREPPADYHQYCFVVARSARQFFENATFDPSQPVADDKTYGHLIHEVVAVDPAHPLPDSRKIVIPGYANLREFSAAHEQLLKEKCGGAWHSYVQRGHWRMIFPFSRASQKSTAERLLADLKENRPPVVHVVRFPELLINHAVLVFDAKESEKDIVFTIYDPNKTDGPRTLDYDRATRTFNFAANDYFMGGRVNVYEVYRSWNYWRWINGLVDLWINGQNPRGAKSNNPTIHLSITPPHNRSRPA